jgi:hypothetical protein
MTEEALKVSILNFVYIQECFVLKGHGNEADFLRFLHKSVPHESLTLSFKLFRFCLRIRKKFIIEKRATDRVRESALKCLKEKPHESESLQLSELPSQGVADSDSRSRGVDDSPNQGVFLLNIQ